MTDDQILLEIARGAIRAELAGREFPDPDPQDYAPALRVRAACFVTLLKAGELRGCVGSLVARQALVIEVAHNAVRAAFGDTRFPPLEKREEHEVCLEISVLSPPEPFEVMDEADLLEQLRPGVDGLTLRQGHRVATFLPTVWEQLPDPSQFVRHLMQKGGWDAEVWPADMQCERYTTRLIQEPDTP